MSKAWAAYDAPELLAAVSRDCGGGWREALLRVDGMHCSACVRAVERALAPLARDVRVNLSAGTVEFTWQPDRHRLSRLLETLDGAGFRPTVLEDDAAAHRERLHRRRMLKRIGVAVILGMQIMMLASGHYFGVIDPSLIGILRWSEFIMAIPVAFYCGWPFLAGFGRALRSRSMTMDVPVATAIMLAFAASAWHTIIGRGDVYFDSVAMFVMLLLSARYFQDAGRARAAERLRRLAAAQPLTAERLHGTATETVALAALQVDDTVVVAPGEAVPVDGMLEAAGAAFDEALLTGESVPAGKRPGDQVLAGSVNVGHAPVQVRVARTGQGTALSQVTRLLHRAESARPRAQVIADRIAGWFLSGMLLLVAAAVVVWWPEGPDRTLTVVLALLVATCPCALSMAMPVALASAASRLARAGVLVARSDVLLRLKQIDTVCFDKTGTLTTGALRLMRTVPLANVDAGQCQAIAAALELGSSHPIARALSESGTSLSARDVEHLAGQGVSGQVGAARYVLGAPERLAPDYPLPPRDRRLTWVMLAEAGRPLALFGLAPQLRPDAAATVAALRDDGLAVGLLSGDGEDAVAAMAQHLGVSQWRARQLPNDKLRHVQALQQQGRRVLAVGDGINDAPLLAAAHASAAMSAGSAMSQARADVLLVGNRLDALPQLLRTAARTRRIVAQNLAWAAGYNMTMVPLAFAGYLTPWMGALGMGLSSLLVVANALRLARVPGGERRGTETAEAVPHTA